MFSPWLFVFIVSSLTYATVDAENDASSPLQEGNCVLPSYPINGTYTVNNNPAATPGKRYSLVRLQISCNSGFLVENNISSIFCVNGYWSSNVPKCVRFCTLKKDPSVEYRCVLTGPYSLTGSRECSYLEPLGTVVTPICKTPNYYSSEVLTNMRCVEGTWDYIATCKPVSSPTFTSVVTEKDSCSLDEHKCLDGSCISLNSLCDGRSDCVDGSDEQICLGLNPVSGFILNRNKRQAQSCRVNQWQCRDGTCIGLDGKCDGTVDCPDDSDETFALCRKTPCQSNWFRCTYGACVDLNAPCNGVQNCADNSDELLPACRNLTANTRGEHKCDNGEVISTVDVCDGKLDCADGSDETLKTCAGTKCSTYLFQCAYGACVDEGSNCNGKEECADGSDESDELCNRISPGQPTSPVTPVRPPLQGGNCVLPPYPKYGTYTVQNNPAATPGKRYSSVRLQISCNSGFQVENNINSIFCENGDWSSIMPKCVHFCRLQKHPSVEYRCVLTGPDSVTGTRECGSLEPSGTVATPICRYPHYYSSEILTNMHCVEGTWDYIATCKPECGTVTPDGTQLAIGGESAKRGELPWHAGIYSKLYTPYMQICGGSLISSSVIISAAHCFWTDAKHLLPANQFAVGVGKLYRPYNENHDADAQKSDVADIFVPTRFRGSASNFQDDIAVVKVGTPFTYEVFIRPVCLNFDVNFDRTQLSDGNIGKVAGWGLTDKNGKASPVLKVVNLPYVKVEDCYAISPPTFRAYITSDKICAGYTNGTTLCQGDSGGGLAFPAYELGTERYYLRGIVSTAPKNDDLCNANTLTTFTSISKHENFIKLYL